MILFRALVVALLLFPSIGTAQTRLDSLRNACNATDDSLRTDALLLLGKQYFIEQNSDDSLIKYSKLAIAIAEKTKNTIQLYTSKKLLALGYVQKGDTINALPALDAALKQAELSKDFKFIADVYHGYAVYYGNLGQTDSSLSYMIREVDAAQKANYYSAMGIGYSSIAWIYRGRKQFDKVLFYHRKALAIADKMEATNLGHIIQVYVTSSQGYLMTAQAWKDSTLMDSAKILADTAMSMAIRYSRAAPQASAYFVYAQHAYFFRQYENAELNALKALEFRNYIENRTSMLMYSTIAVANAHLKNPKRALIYLDSAQHSPALSELYYRNHFAEAAWKVYSLLGNSEEAIKQHDRFIDTKDSLDNIDATRSINEIEQKFHKEENEREIQRLAAEQEITSLNNKLLTAGIGAAVLFALLIFLFYRQRNLKNEQNKMIVEQRLNRARMDPHFLFNTFTALQGLALKEKDPVKVAGFLSDYSVIMRQTLESTFTELISVEDEVDYLRKYLALQQMRTADKFDYTISVDDNIDPMEVMLPGMILQPFIENAIEHGFANIAYRGSLSVSFTKHGENELLIRIVDNGSGITKNETAKEYPSRATQIVRDQLFLLNKKHRCKAEFFLNANNGESGTEVKIFLPLLT
jgi:tetratricopeptide (TPR) repeat protein